MNAHPSALIPDPYAPKLLHAYIPKPLNPQTHISLILTPGLQLHRGKQTPRVPTTCPGRGGMFSSWAPTPYTLNPIPSIEELGA